jgi:hypothetical protein
MDCGYHGVITGCCVVEVFPERNGLLPFSRFHSMNFLSQKFRIIDFVAYLSLSSAISVCTNAFGMSKIITSLFCFALITPVVMIASDAAVGLDASSLEIYAQCVLPFAHTHT